MEQGTRVYYTGDSANHPSEGAISRVIRDPKWGLSYDIVFDDGRLFRSVNPLAFNDGVGRRFYPLAEWMALRAERLKKAQARYQEILAKQT